MRKIEVAAGPKPAKIGFAGRRLGPLWHHGLSGHEAMRRMKIEMRTTIIIAVLLVGCGHLPQLSNNTTEVAKINATKWEVQATEWPLGEERVCVFFGGQNFVGCWEQYDEASQGPHNRDNHPNDRTYLMKADLPENVKQALAQGHNQRVFCARDEAMHLTCPRGGNIK